MRQLTKRETRVILDTLQTLRGPSGYSACDTAVAWLDNGAPVRDKSLSWADYWMPRRDDFVHWLGISLVMAGAIDPPVIDPDDARAFFWERRPQPKTNLPMTIDNNLIADCRYKKAQWYWPTDVLLWGCRQYNKRGTP